MTMFRIINAGPLSTVQDFGIKGYLKYGMPSAGAMDLFSFRIANILVGNLEGDAAIEFTLQGPEIELEADTVIAVTGGRCNPCLDGFPIPMWQSVFVKKGSIIDCGMVGEGFRGYIAFAGGIDVPEVLGSRSTYLKAAVGGFKGRKLAVADELKVNSPHNLDNLAGCLLPKDLIPSFDTEQELRVILGPQDDLFFQSSIEVFLNSIYEITPQSDRMGYRLKGPTIKHKNGADIITDGIPHGAIQVPGEGQPIIMLSDKQATGGYAKVATVISIDLNKVAQLKPGDNIRFRSVTLEEAHKALDRQEKVINNIKALFNESRQRKVRQLKFRIANEDYFVTVEEIG